MRPKKFKIIVGIIGALSGGMAQKILPTVRVDKIKYITSYFTTKTGLTFIGDTIATEIPGYLANYGSGNNPQNPSQPSSSSGGSSGGSGGGGSSGSYSSYMKTKEGQQAYNRIYNTVTRQVNAARARRGR